MPKATIHTLKQLSQLLKSLADPSKPDDYSIWHLLEIQLACQQGPGGNVQQIWVWLCLQETSVLRMYTRALKLLLDITRTA